MVKNKKINGLIVNLYFLFNIRMWEKHYFFSSMGILGNYLKVKEKIIGQFLITEYLKVGKKDLVYQEIKNLYEKYKKEIDLIENFSFKELLKEKFDHKGNVKLNKKIKCDGKECLIKSFSFNTFMVITEKGRKRILDYCGVEKLVPLIEKEINYLIEKVIELIKAKNLLTKELKKIEKKLELIQRI